MNQTFLSPNFTNELNFLNVRVSFPCTCCCLQIYHLFMGYHLLRPSSPRYFDLGQMSRLIFFNSLVDSASFQLKVCVCVKVAQLCPALCDPMDTQSMEFSRPEYWSGQPFPSPGDLPNPGIEPRSALQADSLPAEPPGKPS